jgi:hypothetical protein
MPAWKRESARTFVALGAKPLSGTNAIPADAYDRSIPIGSYFFASTYGLISSLPRSSSAGVALGKSFRGIFICKWFLLAFFFAVL